MTTNDLAKTSLSSGDGFDGYNVDVAGKETKQSGLFRGERLKFGKSAEWESKDGDVIGAETKLIFLDIDRLLVRWGKEKGPPLETVVLAPGEKVPDVEAWNDQVPKSEWLVDMNDKPKGPWQFQQICHLLDPKSMAQFHWVDSTTGGSICIRECIDSVKAMRRFRPGAAPVIELSSKHMNTKFGGRNRPHFVISSWVNLPGEEPQTASLPAPAKVSLEVVKPPTIAEEMNDAIGF